jgi:CTP:molybdopterin cytidylyltransferase MocA
VIVGLVLAAGAGRRFGAQKLLHPVDGEPLLRRTLRSLAAARLDALLVVLGSDAGRVGEALAGLGLRCVLADRWAQGMSASLAAGLDALPASADAVLVVMGDQPGIGAAVVNPLVDAWQAGGVPIVAPRWRDGWGPPVLFARSLFDELRAVRGDRGGRGVVERDPARVAFVAMEGTMPVDVDLPGDVARLD